MTPGYENNPEANAQVLQADGSVRVIKAILTKRATSRSQAG